MCATCGSGQRDDGRSDKSLQTCNACKVVRYCSVECQRAAWKRYGHKQSCRAGPLPTPSSVCALAESHQFAKLAAWLREFGRASEALAATALGAAEHALSPVSAALAPRTAEDVAHLNPIKDAVYESGLLTEALTVMAAQLLKLAACGSSEYAAAGRLADVQARGCGLIGSLCVVYSAHDALGIARAYRSMEAGAIEAALNGLEALSALSPPHFDGMAECCGAVGILCQGSDGSLRVTGPLPSDVRIRAQRAADAGAILTLMAVLRQCLEGERPGPQQSFCAVSAVSALRNVIQGGSPADAARREVAASAGLSSLLVAVQQRFPHPRMNAHIVGIQAQYNIGACVLQ